MAPSQGRWRAGWLAFGLTLAVGWVPRALATPPASAPATALTSQSGHLELVFTADIFGRFAWPGCGPRPSYRAELSHLVSAARTLSAQTELQRRHRPIVVAGGSMMRLDVMGDHIFSRRADLARRLVTQLARVRFDAVAVGVHDFAARPRAFANYSEQMRGHGIPLLAGNVSCKRLDDPRCARLGGAEGKRYLVVERGGLRVGILGVVRGDLLGRIPDPSGRGLVVAEPLEWARGTLKRLREREKVDLALVLADLDLEGRAPRDVLAFVRELGKDAPELVVAGQMYDPGTEAYVEQLKRAGTTIVGTDRFGQHLGQISIAYRREGGRVTLDGARVRHLATRDFDANAVTAAELERIMKALCAALDRPLGDVRFARPVRYTDFLGYVLQVMRLWGRAEVSLLNQSSVADTSFPLEGELTWEKLLRALRTQTTVGWLDLYGSRLIELAGPHALDPKSRLRVLGMQFRDDAWFVNGRPVIAGERYRVATTAFVARGGEGLIALRPTERFVARSMTLRGLMGRFFSRGGAARDGDPRIDPDEDFADLQTKWLVHGSAAAGLAVSNVAAANDGRYAQPLLQRDEVTNLTTEVKLTAGASTRNHAVDVDLQLQYGRTRTHGEAQQSDDSKEQQSVWLESQDRIAASAIYVWRQLRSALGRERWYVPEPFLESRLTSEFTKPPERDHYVDFSGTLGIGLTLHPLLFCKIGAILLVSPEGGSGADSDELLVRPGLYLGYQLKRWRMFQETEHPLDLESRLDFLVTDLTASRRRGELTWQTKAWFELTRFVRLTLTHRLFLLDTRNHSVSWANDVSFGLSLLLDLRRQTF